MGDLMKLQAVWLGSALALLGSGTSSFAEGKFCDPPDYIVRAPASLPESDLSSLLTKEELARPGAVSELLKKPGAFGHSELGFRYLARAFGYQGSWANPEKVELWVAEREYKDPYRFQGTMKLWEKWVSDAEYPLVPVKEGDSLHVFFKEPLEAQEFAGCLATDLARQTCENYSTRKILPGARVYFGKASSRSPCAIRYNGGTITGDAPDKMTASISCSDGKCTQKSERSWEYKNPDKKAGGAETTAAPAAATAAH